VASPTGGPTVEEFLRLCAKLDTFSPRVLTQAELPVLAVRPEGANHQWRKNPPGELSIDPVADERLVRVTAWVGAS
jgi:hypothetical protein